MSRHYTAEEILAILIGIAGGGRMNPLDPPPGIPTFGEALAEDRARGRASPSRPRPRGSSGRRFPLPTQKKKRKVSAYQKEFGRQLKRLKRAHPRTPVTRLMKRAHAATRKARRGK